MHSEDAFSTSFAVILALSFIMYADFMLFIDKICEQDDKRIL